MARLAEAPGQYVESASFSPDGRLLATTRLGIERRNPANMEATIWDWERGEVVATVGIDAARAVFDPTGERIATSRFLEGDRRHQRRARDRCGNSTCR